MVKHPGFFSIFLALLMVSVALASGSTIDVSKTMTYVSSCGMNVPLPDINSSTSVSVPCTATVTYESPTTTTTSSKSSTTVSTTSTKTTSTFENGNSVLYYGVYAAQVPNLGVYSIIQVTNQTFGNGYGGCLSFWVSDNSLSSGYWGQVGYYACAGGPPVAFYQVWDLNSYSVVSAGAVPVSAGDHNFSMTVSKGTTWAFSVDGAAIGAVDMKSISPGSYEPIFAMSEQNEVASAQPFAPVRFLSSVNIDIGGMWTQPHSLQTYQYPNGGWSLVMNGLDSFTVSA